MKDIHKYLYAISAACFIGVGSGFVTLTPYVLDYEAKAMLAGYELEQATKQDYSKGIDCNKFSELHAKCHQAKYLIKTNTATVGFLTKVAYSLLGLGLASVIIGFAFHPSKKDANNAL